MQPIVVIISAESEWRAVRELHPEAPMRAVPYGEWCAWDEVSGVVRSAWPDDPNGRGEGGAVVLYHGGWGKIAAAASAQYAIDRWRPRALVNLGTCGGLEGCAEVGDVILASRVLVYDMHIEIGDRTAEEAHYTTTLPAPAALVGALAGRLDGRLRIGTIASGDRDLVRGEVPRLIAKYGAVAGDWESAAIAFVAARNGVPCVILRGVSDVVGPDRADAYDGRDHIFERGVRDVMGLLLALVDPLASHL